MNERLNPGMRPEDEKNLELMTDQEHFGKLMDIVMTMLEPEDRQEILDADPPYEREDLQNYVAGRLTGPGL